MTHAGAVGGLRWLWLAAIVVAADQATKIVASGMLELHRPVAVAPFVNLTLTHNTGAAFSLLSGAGGWQRWLFVALAIAVSAFIVAWLRGLPRTERWVACALALLLGGALGNLWDRLVHGVVVDFVDVYYGAYHWPAFNVADTAICIGAGMLLASMARPEKTG